MHPTTSWQVGASWRGDGVGKGRRRSGREQGYGRGRRGREEGCVEGRRDRERGLGCSSSLLLAGVGEKGGRSVYPLCKGCQEWKTGLGFGV